tara:strand:+ start:163 stop:393 length:231 start_codon:yes stop_codon:yes gene_type:complete
MRWLIKRFTEHPRSVGETYWQHFFSASRISARFAVACTSQLVHAIFPFVQPPLKSDINSLTLFLNEMQPDVRKQKK